MLRRLALLVACGEAWRGAWRRRGVYKRRADMPPLDVIAREIGEPAPWTAPKWVWGWCWRLQRRALPLLHALESVARGGVGTLAETALESAAAADASGATRGELDALRLATRRENARRAAARGGGGVGGGGGVVAWFFIAV